MLFFISCSGLNYKRLSADNPSALIAMADSLLEIKPSEVLFHSLGKAHNSIGEKFLKKKEFSEAKNSFSKALSYSKNDTSYLYNYYMTEGHILLKKGNKNGLWDGIEFYYKALKLKPRLGEPHYYIGQCYQKIGSKDFDLIIESYQNALQLTLSDELKNKINYDLEKPVARKNRLEKFWK